MPGRCVVTAAQRVYPYREPGSIVGHRRRLMHRAHGATLDLSGRWWLDQASYRPGAVTSLQVVGDDAPAAAPRPAGLPGGPRGRSPRVVVGAPAEAAFDTVVASMALCCVDHLDHRLGEIGTWLRPGGQLLALEHVRGVGITGLSQRLVSPVTARLGTTCRLDLDLAGALRAAGFEITDAARFTARVGGVAVPCLAAVARTREPRP